MGIGLGQGSAGELAGATADCAKERPLGVVGKPGPIDVDRESLLQIVVTGQCVILAALLVRRTQVFTNARLCKAVLDRLTDQAHIIETGLESYRFRRTMRRKTRE